MLCFHISFFFYSNPLIFVSFDKSHGKALSFSFEHYRSEKKIFKSLSNPESHSSRLEMTNISCGVSYFLGIGISFQSTAFMTNSKCNLLKSHCQQRKQDISVKPCINFSLNQSYVISRHFLNPSYIYVCENISGFSIT